MNTEIDYQKLAKIVAEELRKELLSRNEVCVLLGYSKKSSMFNRLLAQDSSFPKPTELVESGRQKWFKSEVLTWLERQRERRAKLTLQANRVA